ncbi:esterase-like activity of phytase family protein [Streptomyces olivaceus]|uniref:Esterase-like activity of phytase family protein n=1 Tax=Streptomyces olivaceus TaxID=47716 RepID=A0ABS7W4R7_STROV|nr:esterase-like activity of phytase family protein [Streptomyces olivaceus]MBZ6090613.1 esterase-like activity of phytase family protein [Streptomyces olivaceus]MBZ6096789.1 esterase-like activity of phytase family protein [Streptomyces olivaceus]MBZ6117561.1 esterase-like activity of phytase family protein [Streptomyces olivaceus]MBZ6152971.1 esterase-like activity of phytase family protein [Streptomyces olivaceus]MBZ6193841.1 esterase-like activity of phytase family protein [Streptomyces ol
MRPRILRTALAALTAGLAAAGCLTAAGPAAAQGSSPGNSQRNACSRSVSLAGFSDVLDKTTYDGTYVGNLSALAPDRHGSLAALADRSSLFRLDARTLQPRGVIPLADEEGAALDSEGLVVDRDGTYLVSSETEPSVRRYSRTGEILGRLPVPDDLRTAPEGRAQENGSFEGLTLLPGGRTLLASMEYQLDGDPADLVRLQTWQRTRDGGFRLGDRYTYRTDAGLGVSEVTALPDGRLLVLERGFTSGVGNTIRLHLADRPGRGTPRGTPLPKRLLADLADCPSLGATAGQPQPNPLLDNFEGMAVTGRSRDRTDVLIVSDDNQNDVQTTRFLRLRVRT